MSIFTLFIITLTLLSCSSKKLDESMMNGSVSNIVYYTKNKDGSTYYAIFPSPLWDIIATSVQDHSRIPKKGIFIRSHINNGLWVNGIRKDIPSTGGAFYLKRSGELVKIDLTTRELNSISTEKGITLSKRIQKKYYEEEK